MMQGQRAVEPASVARRLSDGISPGFGIRAAAPLLATGTRVLMGADTRGIGLAGVQDRGRMRRGGRG